MWSVTGWLVRTWLRITLLLALGLGIAWLVWGPHSGPFLIAVLVAGLAELWTIRQLVREWSWRASSSWWWSR